MSFSLRHFLSAVSVSCKIAIRASFSYAIFDFVRCGYHNIKTLMSLDFPRSYHDVTQTTSGMTPAFLLFLEEAGANLIVKSIFNLLVLVNINDWQLCVVNNFRQLWETKKGKSVDFNPSFVSLGRCVYILVNHPKKGDLLRAFGLAPGSWTCTGQLDLLRAVDFAACCAR